MKMTILAGAALAAALLGSPLRAEEKAMALPAKMMIPLILFIFPCLIGILMLPAIYRIKETLMK